MRKRITHLLLALAIVVCAIGGGASHVYGASTVTDRIDGVSTSLAIKAPVRVATTANITLSGLQTVDGVLLTTGERVLVKNQTTATANGIYQANTSSWSRALDFDGNRDAATGTMVAVTAGSTNINTYWRVSAANPVTIGTTSITWERASVSDGATVSFLQAGTGAVTRTIQDKAREVVSTLDYGCVGDGTTDDTTCLNNLFANTGKECRLVKGTYRITANLAVPACETISGEGDINTTIAAAAGVTAALTLNGNYTLIDFGVSGNATASAKGIIVGNVSNTRVIIERVRVASFTGANAVAIHFKMALKSTINSLTVTGSTTNVLLESSGGLPTTLAFNNLYAGTATGIGVDVVSGFNIAFSHSVFESNVLEGLYVRPDSSPSDTTEVLVDNSWFEDNRGGVASEYHMVCSAAVRTARVIVQNTYFAAGARAMRMTGAFCGFVVINPVMQSAANQFVVETGAAGHILNYGNTDPAISFTDSAGFTQGVALPWKAWTPTYSSDIGNAAATFSGAVTTTLARYRLVGKTLHMQVKWSGTLQAVTPAYIALTMPAGAGQSANMDTPALVTDNATQATGFIRSTTGSAFRFYRMDSATYTSAGLTAGAVSAVLEIQ